MLSFLIYQKHDCMCCSRGGSGESGPTGTLYEIHMINLSGVGDQQN